MALLHPKSSVAFAAHSLTHLSVPKTRRPKFELHLRILDLNNVPLVSGTSFVKWHLHNSPAAEHRGRTEKHNIQNHKIMYNYDALVPVRMVIDKNGYLQEQCIEIEVLQEYSQGGKAERIKLGHVKLNLAEYVEPSEQEGEEGVVRRYLMQDSKINSTLKVSIYMRQTEGDRNFVTPPLKTAPAFGGIAGIMAGEQADPDDVGHMPSLSKKSGETAELQDLYRRTLTADWTCQYGGMDVIPSADRVVEDIFAGGNGWGVQDANPRSPTKSAQHGDSSGSVSGNDGQGPRRSRRAKKHSISSMFGGQKDGKKRSHESLSRTHSRRGSGVRGRSSFEHQAQQMKSETHHGRSSRSSFEVSEFDIRDDLRSWKLPSS